MKLSIILPVYNVEKFVAECIESLETQDLLKEDYEIIFVDDGSPDNSAGVIQELQERYSNIRLIRQANAGVCAARNNGLQTAQGDYVCFIDPDDYIQANCLGKMLESIEEAKADLLVYEMKWVSEESSFDPKDQDEIVVELQNEYASKGSGCQYIVRRSYLQENHIVFDGALAYGEDYLWAFQINYRKHVGLKTSAPIYRYRQRSGSAMHGRSKEKQVRHMNDMHRLAIIYGQEYERCKKEQLPKKVLKNIKSRKQLCVQSAITDLIRLAESKAEVKERLKQMKQEKLYPYPWMWWHLFDRSIQAPLKVKLFCLFFPIRWYVVWMNACFRKSKRK